MKDLAQLVEEADAMAVIAAKSLDSMTVSESTLLFDYQLRKFGEAVCLVCHKRHKVYRRLFTNHMLFLARAFATHAKKNKRPVHFSSFASSVLSDNPNDYDYTKLLMWRNLFKATSAPEGSIRKRGYYVATPALTDFVHGKLAVPAFMDVWGSQIRPGRVLSFAKDIEKVTGIS